MTADSVRNVLQALADAEGGQRALARKIGVSASFLNDILLGKREPAGKVLAWLKLDRVVDYKARK